MSTPAHLRIPPPTPHETELYCKYLKKGWYQGTIAARLGWTKSRMDAIMRYGRAGVPGFKEFVDKCDDLMFEEGSQFLSLIHDKAIKEMNLTALTWWYDRRWGYREKMLQQQELKEEQAMLEGVSAGAPTEDEIAAAEARALLSSNENADTGDRH